jgi:UMF1 family MFS transporter
MTSTPSEVNPGLYARVLTTLGLGRPELRAWAMYDWANSAMVTTIIAAVFPAYFEKVAAKGLGSDRALMYFGAATTLAMTIIAVLAPILGPVADDRPIKKKMLGAFMAVGVVAVAGMYWIHTGDWVLALVLFIVANIGANGSFVFYDSLLPHVATHDEVDRVSSAGYALGYVGGGILLVLNLLWIQKPEWFGLPSGPNMTEAQATLPARLSFVSVAVWWVVFSIPLFRTVPEPPVEPAAAAELTKWGPMGAAFRRLGKTFRELRSFKQGFLMLLAFLIYNDGIGTIFRMAVIFGAERKIDAGAMIAAIVLVQFVGIPFAFLFGALAGRFGAKRSILFALVVYIGIALLASSMRTATHFLALAVLVGMVQGGSQALSRSLFSSLIPRDRSGEFFGFFAVVEKFAGIFGPLAFTASIKLTGSSHYAILSVILFFVVGGVLLAMVDVEAGQREAKEGGTVDAAVSGAVAST